MEVSDGITGYPLLDENDHVTGFNKAPDMSMKELKEGIFGKYVALPDPICEFESQDLVRSRIKYLLNCVCFLKIFRNAEIFLFSTSNVLVQENRFVTLLSLVGF